MKIEEFHRDMQLYGRGSYRIPGVATVELSYGESPPPVESIILLNIFLRCVAIAIKSRNWTMFKNLYDIHGEHIESAQR